MKQDEHEIAEALFDLATLAADVDKEPEVKASKRKKPRTTKRRERLPEAPSQSFRRF